MSLNTILYRNIYGKVIAKHNYTYVQAAYHCTTSTVNTTRHLYTREGDTETETSKRNLHELLQ